MKKILLLMLVSTFLLVIPRLVTAALILEDHFDDNTLLGWAISLENATDWTYEESGTNLTVTEIERVDLGAWAKVILSKSFTPLSDFSLDLDFSWDSRWNNMAMQNLFFRLYDTAGNTIARGGYNDAWVSYRGQKYAAAGGSSHASGIGTMPYSGSASINVLRVGNQVDFFWDALPLVSGLDNTPISGIDLEFCYFPYSSGNYVSFFGTESVDLVRVEGAPVPEPTTMLLLGCGLIGLAGFRRKFRKG